MYRFLLAFTLLFSSNLAFSEIVETAVDSTDSSVQVALPTDSIADSVQKLVSPEAKPDSEKKEDEIEKDLGYQIGYQVTTYGIPLLLMVLVSFLIYRRSQRK